MEFDLENPFMSLEDFENDTVTALFANEVDHMALESHQDSDNLRFSSIRGQAFSLISHAQCRYNLDPFISYLAVNYVDRFIAKTKILEKKRWIIGILSISSLSLAAKMRNTDISISLYDLQREEGLVFDFPTIHRMEVLILTTLSWRMRSITPFSFLNFFISLLRIQDSSLAQALKLHSWQIIFNSHHEMKLLEYKPSLIAASAFLCAIHELIPEEFSLFRVGMSSCEYLNEEKLLDCLRVMQDMVKDVNEAASRSRALSSCTMTPKSVLDQQYCTSFESGKSSTVTQRDNIKRRRLNEFCEDQPFQISQIQHC